MGALYDLIHEEVRASEVDATIFMVGHTTPEAEFDAQTYEIAAPPRDGLQRAFLLSEETDPRENVLVGYTWWENIRTGVLDDWEPATDGDGGPVLSDARDALRAWLKEVAA